MMKDQIMKLLGVLYTDTTRDSDQVLSDLEDIQEEVHDLIASLK